MSREKEKELTRKLQPPSTPQAASTASLASAGGLTLNLNLSGGAQQQDILPRESTNDEGRYRGSATPSRAITPLQPLVTPSSPIPQARDEDARLTAFICSRIKDRPAQRAEFERAFKKLAEHGVGLSDMASLTREDWKEIGIGHGIRVDLLRHDKIWHQRHPESVKEADSALYDEFEHSQSFEINNSD
ncbi:hypothetical protein EPUS_09412 [Endocarpon pusillum Z07020]|uniref:SAM domain-containing protein n=1 Tax=Endocarpon pusillum (strain Z07020 / HMAS-L-300199) TaxID=1263415 RepID=U1HQQ1_ENDPU|nr:uncharacterized protein EPUS_09412 [Endocarpon pusillum Z07020]ERF72765.1 hypothetical protein EPUS_09412 [Endocarpon pusillum Z07020]